MGCSAAQTFRGAAQSSEGVAVSYYVIKGPDGSDQYLSVIVSYEQPQWRRQRNSARCFPDAISARAGLANIRKVWPNTLYTGRVVRVNTSADLRAERLRLRQQASHIRVLVLDEVEHAIMNGPIIRGGTAARTLNDVLAAVRDLRVKPMRLALPSHEVKP